MDRDRKWWVVKGSDGQGQKAVGRIGSGGWRKEATGSDKKQWVVN